MLGLEERAIDLNRSEEAALETQACAIPTSPSKLLLNCSESEAEAAKSSVLPTSGSGPV